MPKLNPIEMIWGELREKGFRNEIFSTLEKIVDRLCEVVVLFANDTKRVALITYRQWLNVAFMF
jgi:putative transposase